MNRTAKQWIEHFREITHGGEMNEINAEQMKHTHKENQISEKEFREYLDKDTNNKRDYEEAV